MILIIIIIIIIEKNLNYKNQSEKREKNVEDAWVFFFIMFTSLHNLQWHVFSFLWSFAARLFRSHSLTLHQVFLLSLSLSQSFFHTNFNLNFFFVLKKNLTVATFCAILTNNSWFHGCKLMSHWRYIKKGIQFVKKGQ